MRSKPKAAPAEQPPPQPKPQPVSEADILWSQARPVPTLNPNEYRYDPSGNIIRRDDYGNRRSPYGWEIDHVTPQARGGVDDLVNKQPLQWEANVQKSDGLTIEDILRGRRQR